jgi:hypothetical protein
LYTCHGYWYGKHFIKDLLRKERHQNQASVKISTQQPQTCTNNERISFEFWENSEGRATAEEKTLTS